MKYCPQARLLFLFFAGFGLVTPSLHGGLSWTLNPTTKTSATATRGGDETFIYALSQALDNDLFLGPIKYTNTTTDEGLIYNTQPFVRNGLFGLGEWYFHVGDQEWHYNPALRTWSPSNGLNATWEVLSDITFTHLINHDSWTMLDTITRIGNAPTMPQWTHTITDQTDATSTHTWYYDFDANSWQNVTLETTWTFDYTTMQWTCAETGEVWQVNPETESIFFINFAHTKNSWVQVDKNKWREENNGVYWRYLNQTNDAPAHWENQTSGETYSFDGTSHSWKEDISGSVALLPPFFPSPVVQQAELTQSIAIDLSRNGALLQPLFALVFFSTYHRVFKAPGIELAIDLPDYPALYPGEPLGDYERPTYTFTLNDTSTISLTPNVLTDAAVAVFPRGETYTSSSSPALAFTNTSSGIVGADCVNYLPATDSWSYTDTANSHYWQYWMDKDQWHNPGTNSWFSFDIQTQTWQLIDATTDEATDTQWRYLLNDGDVRVWRNLSTMEEWCFQGDDVWKNLTTEEEWSQSGTTINAGLQRLGDSSTWHYDPNTTLWHNDSNHTQSQDLFPMLPPNVAIISGLVAKMALANNNTDLDAPGFIQKYKTDAADGVDALETAVNAAVESEHGLERVRALTPLLSNLVSYRLKADADLELTFLLNPFEGKHVGESEFPTTHSTTFPVWAPSRNYFCTPGFGAFTARPNVDPDARVNNFVIGLTAAPSLDGTATYSVSIDFNELTELYTITVYKGETVLYTQENTSLYGHWFWFLYENGRIRMGASGPVDIGEFRVDWNPRDNVSFHQTTLALFVQTMLPYGFDASKFLDYTIDDDDVPATINHFSVNSTDEGFDSVFIYPQEYDAFSTIIRIQSLATTCQDSLILSPLEEIWVEAKALINQMMTTDVTSYQRNSRATAIENLLTGSTLSFDPTAVISDLQPLLLNPTSQDYYEYIYHSLNNGSGSISQYLFYSSLLKGLEDSFTSLLIVDPTALTTEERQSYIDDTRATISNLIDLMSANIANLIFVTDSLCNIAGNEDLASYKNLYHEEIALLRDLSAVLALIDPLILERFTQQLSLYALSSADAQAEVAQNEIRSAQERDTATRLLAARLAAGDSTLFSALNAGAITFCVNSKFDDIRAKITEHLLANGYSDFHSFGIITDEAIAYSTLKTIFDVIKPQLDIAGNQFVPSFSGNQKSFNPSTTQTYITNTVTAQVTAIVAKQQKTAPTGSSDYLQNSYFTTSSDEHVTSFTREIITASDDKTANYSRLYVKDSIIALGNANMNIDSGNSVSILGGAEIAPNGSALVKLNSDILVSGPNFLCPSANFGYDVETATRCIPAVPLTRRGRDEITFHSETPRSIVITAGTTLDLTSFNNARVPGGQRIVFSGQTRLVFEPNTRLRLPYTSPADSQYQLILEFRDNAQLIFQGTENLDTERWNSPEGPDAVRTKILGVGTLQFNDQASASVLRSALVSVEADYTSNATNLVVELNGQSGWYVGDQNVSGGGFQVGNIADGGSNNLDLVTTHYPNNDTNPLFGDTDTPFIPHPTHIDFTLNLLGPNATFYIGRGGFVGFGVGTVNKSGLINGSLTNSSIDPMTDADHFGCWEVHSLYNTGNISLNIQNGTFSHHQIAPGTSSSASLLAFGPQIPRALYLLSLNTAHLNSIQGGGNVLFLRSGVTDPLPVPIWSSTAPLSGGSDDNGKYSLLAPVPLIATRRQQDAARPGIYVYGRAAVSQSGTAFQFTGPLDEFYLATTFQRLSLNNRFVISSLQNQRNSVTLIDNSGQVVTKAIQPRAVRTKNGRPVTATDLALTGYLQATTRNSNPQKFIKN